MSFVVNVMETTTTPLPDQVPASWTPVTTLPNVFFDPVGRVFLIDAFGQFDLSFDAIGFSFDQNAVIFANPSQTTVTILSQSISNVTLQVTLTEGVPFARFVDFQLVDSNGGTMDPTIVNDPHT